MVYTIGVVVAALNRCYYLRDVPLETPWRKYPAVYMYLVSLGPVGLARFFYNWRVFFERNYNVLDVALALPDIYLE